MIRAGLAVYGLLLRAMPTGFRKEFGTTARADLGRMLDRAATTDEEHVPVVAAKACWDLMSRLPAEWWAHARQPSRFDAGRREHLELGRWERMMNWMKEMRLAARTLARKPGFTVVSVLTLALGIGANVAIFAIVNAVLLEPLQFEESEKIVEVRHHAPGLGFDDLQNSAGTLAFWRENADFYEVMAAFQQRWANLTGSDEAARVSVIGATPEIFQVLRTQPMMGRPFNEGDVLPDQPTVALLAYDSWRSRFGSDPGIVGSTIRLDGRPMEVIGVMPESFAFPDDDAEIFAPRYVDPDGPFGTFGLGVVARLQPDVTVDAAQRRSDEMMTRLPEFFPDLQAEFLERAGFTVSVGTLRDRMVADVEAILWILLGTVVFVLLIAAANVANLFLVRAESRQKEMAVRAAMGAGRRGVATSFLSESLLLGLAGGAAGILVARAGIPLLLSLGEVPRAANVSLDGSVLALAGLLSVGVGIVFGAFPMTRYAGDRLAGILRDGSRGSTAGRERHRARNVLVATQLAMALVLLVGSGLMLRSFAQLRAVELGFEPEGVLAVGMNRTSGEDPMVAARFFQDAADRLASLPGVAQVGIATGIPLAGGNVNGGSFYIESRPRQDESNELPPTAMYRAVGSDYFTSIGMELLEGRAMERADWEEQRAVVWVNETFARTHLGGTALGERIAWNVGEDQPQDSTRWAEVVGVVADVREFGLDNDDRRPNAYFPLVPGGGAAIELQSAWLTVSMAPGQDPASVAPAARTELRALDPTMPVSTVETMEQVVATEMEAVSATMIILAIATGMALFLGAIGLAGVISYVMGQRIREIGVRVALGATRGDVTRMILRQSLTVTVVGMLVGLGGAFGLTRLMGALLFEVSATDPLTFAVAPVVLVAVSLLATWLPVRRATRVDPTVALRAE